MASLFRRVNHLATIDHLVNRPSSPLDELLAQTVARHFPGSEVDGAVARIGLGDVRIACQVAPGTESAMGWVVPLFLRMWGGLLPDDPVFASISGYGDTEEAAVEDGGALWAASFGGVLRAGLAGLPDDDPDLKVFAALVQKAHVRLAHGALGRVHSSHDLSEAERATALLDARLRLTGGPSLTATLLDWRGLPLLDLKRSVVLSTFVMDRPDGRVVEVKVNGEDLPTEGWLRDAPSSPDGVVVLLRELAVVTRIG